VPVSLSSTSFTLVTNIFVAQKNLQLFVYPDRKIKVVGNKYQNHTEVAFICGGIIGVVILISIVWLICYMKKK
jgi:nitrate reductase gamma subunit